MNTNSTEPNTPLTEQHLAHTTPHVLPAPLFNPYDRQVAQARQAGHAPPPALLSTPEQDEERRLAMLQLQYERQQRTLAQRKEFAAELEQEEQDRLARKVDDPTPAEIRKTCAAIRRTWSRNEYLVRFYYTIKVRGTRSILQNSNPSEMDYTPDPNGTNEDCPLYGTPCYPDYATVIGLPHPLGWSESERMFHASHLNRSA